MPKRTIKTALATYRDKDGNAGAFGFRGDEVEVHPDDVERFDSLNAQPGGDDEHEPSRSQVSLVSPAAGAATSGTGSGLNTTVEDADDSKSTRRRAK